MQFVLCSGSARRLELLQQMGIEPKVIVSEFSENLSKDAMSASDYVINTSLGKLKWVKDNFELGQSVLVSADTVVCCNGKIYEKPITKERNLEMLKTFQRHGEVEVLSGVHIFNTETNYHDSFVSSTRCYVSKSVTNADLESYVNTFEGLQVAGGFKIQGLGAMLFDRIDGDYYNVVGLPFGETYHRIKIYKQELL